jgi:hypothetical protein
MAISGGVDLASQLYSNGGNWHAVDWSHVGGMAVIGGVSYGVGTVVSTSQFFALSSPITQQVAGAYVGGFVQGLGVGMSNGLTGLDLFGTATFSAGAGAVTAGVAGTIGKKLANRSLRNGHYEPGGESVAEFPGVPNAAEPSKRVPYEVRSSTATPTQYSDKTIRIPDMTRPISAELAENFISGNKLAFGLHAGLTRFARAINGLTYREFTSGGFQQDEILAAMKNSNNTLHFDLTGFSKTQYLTRFDPTQLPKYPNITNWEIHTIYNTPGLLERTTFYRLETGIYEIVPGPF